MLKPFPDLFVCSHLPSRHNMEFSFCFFLCFCCFIDGYTFSFLKSVSGHEHDKECLLHAEDDSTGNDPGEVIHPQPLENSAGRCFCNMHSGNLGSYFLPHFCFSVIFRILRGINKRSYRFINNRLLILSVTAKMQKGRLNWLI